MLAAEIIKCDDLRSWTYGMEVYDVIMKGSTV